MNIFFRTKLFKLRFRNTGSLSYKIVWQVHKPHEQAYAVSGSASVALEALGAHIRTAAAAWRPGPRGAPPSRCAGACPSPSLRIGHSVRQNESQSAKICAHFSYVILPKWRYLLILAPTLPACSNVHANFSCSNSKNSCQYRRRLRKVVAQRSLCLPLRHHHGCLCQRFDLVRRLWFEYVAVAHSYTQILPAVVPRWVLRLCHDHLANAGCMALR